MAEPTTEEPVYHLQAIVAKHGESTEEDVRDALEGISVPELIAKGADVGTPRLCKELARNYGIFLEWLPRATPAQLELLVFVDVPWLKMAAWAGRQAEIRYEAHQKGRSLGAAAKQVREAEAEGAIEAAKAGLERARIGLQHLGAGIVTWKARLHAAYATNEGTVPATGALAALCNVGDEMLKDTSKPMLKRRAHSRIDAALLQKWREIAAAAEKAGHDAAAVKPAPPVSQANVDEWDGIAISLFEQFVDAVDQARQDDPSIPAPSIIGLRSWFRRTRKKPAPAASSAAPAGSSAGG